MPEPSHETQPDTLMGMLHVTCATSPRPGKAHNEDLVGASDGLFFVLDGSSVPPGLPACCDRGAAWYVRRLSAAILASLAGNDGVELADGLAAAIATVSAEHNETCPAANTDSLGPSAAVALVRHREDILDYLLLGDVTLLLETGTGVQHHCDRRLSTVAPDARRKIREHLRAGRGYDDEAYRQLVLQLVTAEREARNTPGGYWIASNVPSAAHEAVSGSRNIAYGEREVHCFALASDGLSRSVDVLDVHPSWDALMEALAIEGPSACIRAVRQAETEDLHGKRHPRTSATDDASGLVAQLPLVRP